MSLENTELEKLNIKINFDTSKISWLKSGGKTNFYCKVKNQNHLTDLFKYINSRNIPFIIVGNFSNTLVRSSGFEGLLLKLSDDFSNPRKTE